MKPKELPKKDALVKAPAGEAAGVTGVPSYLQKGDRVMSRGLEGVERQDMPLPRLGLCQSMTPQRKKSDPKYIPGLEEGQYFNTITGEVYGGDAKLIPLYFYKTRILFNPLDDGGGIRCQAFDARTGQGDPGGPCDRCPLAQFTKDDAPECSLFYNYAAIVLPKGNRQPGMDSLIVVSFKSTSLKVARDWNALMRLRNVDSFAGIYEFTSAEQSNSAGQTWYTPVVKNAGWVPENVYQVAEAMYDSVKETQAAGRLNVEQEHPEAEHGKSEI